MLRHPRKFSKKSSVFRVLPLPALVQKRSFYLSISIINKLSYLKVSIFTAPKSGRDIVAAIQNNGKSVQRFFRTKAQCALVCAPLSLSAKELVCLVRFSRATSALEPPPYAAVLLPSAALPSRCAVTNFLLVVKIFSVEAEYT